MHIEALREDSGPEALLTHGQHCALQVFYEILKHSAGELSANCSRTITMTRYKFLYISCESPPCYPDDWHGSDQQDTSHGRWDHRPWLDSPRTVVVSGAAAALGTTEAARASFTGTATSA